MKRYIATSIMILISSINFSQTDSLLFTRACPVIGWDSLASIIQKPKLYPEIARRAGLTTNLSIYLTIDSTGNFVKVEPIHPPYNSSDSLINRLFIPPIENVLKSVEWNAGLINNKPVDDKIYLWFNFYLFDPDNKTFNIIAPVTKVQKVN